MRQTKLAIFLSIALLCLGCQGTKRKRAAINEQPKEEYIEYASDGFVRKYFDTQFNLVHYKSKATYYREAYYANGQPIVDSIAKDYYITGELQFIGHIASENPDVLFGLGTWYYKNGNIETKYSLNKKGEIEGKCLSYYNSGKLKSEYYYKDGIMNGNSTEYYENGNVKLHSQMVGGKQSGETKEYYESGKLYAVFHCSNGVLNGNAKTYYENGKIQSEGTYTNGSKNGLWKYYDLDGNFSYQDPNQTVHYSNIPSPSRSNTPDDAYSEGYDAGYEQGQYDGRHGKSHGYGYDDSSSYYGHYETRYQEGYEEGYDDGYSSGYSDYEDEEGEED
jgi:antitoxin component YwqK of YwqJK toxin-antitoxin module